MSAPIRVLMVCTGNICRSPTAEAVLRRQVAQAGLERLVQIESAGTVDYHSGSPPDPRAQDSAAKRGYDMSRLRARQLRATDFDRFDLLVAMDRGHAEHLLANRPAQQDHRIRLLMDFASGGPPGIDVPDPYYGSPAGFERVLDMIEAACTGLMQDLQQRLRDRAEP